MKYNIHFLNSLLNSNSWIEFKNNLESEFNNDYCKIGKQFEVFAKLYFQYAPLYRNDFKNVWLFNEVPRNIKTILNLTNVDHGSDLILQHHNNKLYIVQCKYRNKDNSKLNWTEDLISNLFAVTCKADYYILFTNTTNLDNFSNTRTEKFLFINKFDLIELKDSFFKELYSHINKQKEIKYEKYTPKPHQQEAINKAIEHFKINNRGQLILPCGAGKTLIALWIKEAFKAKSTLVLVPSLALIRQIKNDWKIQSSKKFNYLCVCSSLAIDNDINTENDYFEITFTSNVDCVVTTDEFIIKDFLLENNHEKIIFATYQSLHNVESATKLLGSDFKFDLLICDEAHKTASINQNNFTLMHNNNKINIDKRIYMTATPRVLSQQKINNLNQIDNENYIYDMNNSNIFGKEFYRMSFKEAIEQNILVDYKILAVGVSDKQINNFIKEKKYIIEQNTTLNEIANNFALNLVMEKYELKHAILFHSRIINAANFTKRHQNLFPNTKSFHINGKQASTTIQQTLYDFQNSKLSIISNARCLTEGVDIPIVDTVYFCDNKNSKIDIVQATGRALRKAEGKTLGYIIIPIYHTKEEDLATDIENSSFNKMITIIKAMAEEDERLDIEITNLVITKNMKNSNNSNSKFDLLKIDEKDNTISLVNFNNEELKKSLFDQIIEKTVKNWILRFCELKEFIENNNRLPRLQLKNEAKLFNWLNTQKINYYNNVLSIERINCLQTCNIIFNFIIKEEKNNINENLKNLYIKIKNNYCLPVNNELFNKFIENKDYYLKIEQSESQKLETIIACFDKNNDNYKYIEILNDIALLNNNIYNNWFDNKKTKTCLPIYETYWIKTINKKVCDINTDKEKKIEQIYNFISNNIKLPTESDSVFDIYNEFNKYPQTYNSHRAQALMLLNLIACFDKNNDNYKYIEILNDITLLNNDSYSNWLDAKLNTIDNNSIDSYQQKFILAIKKLTNKVITENNQNKQLLLRNNIFNNNIIKSCDKIILDNNKSTTKQNKPLIDTQQQIKNNNIFQLKNLNEESIIEDDFITWLNSEYELKCLKSMKSDRLNNFNELSSFILQTRNENFNKIQANITLIASDKIIHNWFNFEYRSKSQIYTKLDFNKNLNKEYQIQNRRQNIYAFLEAHSKCIVNIENLINDKQLLQSFIDFIKYKYIVNTEDDVYLKWLELKDKLYQFLYNKYWNSKKDKNKNKKININNSYNSYNIKTLLSEDNLKMLEMLKNN